MYPLYPFKTPADKLATNQWAPYVVFEEDPSQEASIVRGWQVIDDYFKNFKIVRCDAFEALDTVSVPVSKGLFSATYYPVDTRTIESRTEVFKLVVENYKPSLLKIHENFSNQGVVIKGGSVAITRTTDETMVAWTGKPLTLNQHSYFGIHRASQAIRVNDKPNVYKVILGEGVSIEHRDLDIGDIYTVLDSKGNLNYPQNFIKEADNATVLEVHLFIGMNHIILKPDEKGVYHADLESLPSDTKGPILTILAKVASKFGKTSITSYEVVGSYSYGNDAAHAIWDLSKTRSIVPQFNIVGADILFSSFRILKGTIFMLPFSLPLGDAGYDLKFSRINDIQRIKNSETTYVTIDKGEVQSNLEPFVPYFSEQELFFEDDGVPFVLSKGLPVSPIAIKLPHATIYQHLFPYAPMEFHVYEDGDHQFYYPETNPNDAIKYSNFECFYVFND